MTEWISGVNIPSCQLMIGMGVPLHRIPDIRRLFGQDPRGTSTINFDSDPQIEPSGALPARPSHTGNRECNALPLTIQHRRNASASGSSIPVVWGCRTLPAATCRMALTSC